MDDRTEGQGRRRGVNEYFAYCAELLRQSYTSLCSPPVDTLMAPHLVVGAFLNFHHWIEKPKGDFRNDLREASIRCVLYGLKDLMMVSKYTAEAKNALRPEADRAARRWPEAWGDPRDHGNWPHGISGVEVVEIVTDVLAKKGCLDSPIRMGTARAAWKDTHKDEARRCWEKARGPESDDWPPPLLLRVADS